jgi:hypothetical protein
MAQVDDTEEVRYIPLEEMDDETRREVLKTRRAIKLVAYVSIGMIGLMMILTLVAVMLTYGD